MISTLSAHWRCAAQSILLSAASPWMTPVMCSIISTTTTGTKPWRYWNVASLDFLDTSSANQMDARMHSLEASIELLVILRISFLFLSYLPPNLSYGCANSDWPLILAAAILF